MESTLPTPKPSLLTRLRACAKEVTVGIVSEPGAKIAHLLPLAAGGLLVGCMSVVGLMPSLSAPIMTSWIAATAVSLTTFWTTVGMGDSSQVGLPLKGCSLTRKAGAAVPLAAALAVGAITYHYESKALESPLAANSTPQEPRVQAAIPTLAARPS